MILLALARGCVTITDTMCRMLAIIGSSELQHTALQAFYRLGKQGQVRPWESAGHMDGWGIAIYGASGPDIVKISAQDVTSESKLYRKAVREVVKSDARVVMAHLRKATQGEKTIENTQPFISGKWLFAHNGTIGDMGKLGPSPPLNGDTDSEEFFKRWCAQGRDISGSHNWVELVAEQCEFTSLTSIICDGKLLLGCHKAVKELPPSGYENIEYKNCPYVNTLLHWQRGREHVLVSEPINIDGAEWRSIAEGEFLTLDVG